MRLSNLSRPKLFEKGNMTLNDNEHIAGNVINKHLDPNIDSGTRNIITVKKSVKWISSFTPECANVLDVGCGPGIYSKKLSHCGYKVTGIDISQYSIEYAQSYLQNNDNPISYVYADIVDYQIHQKYDTILILYALYSFFDRDDRLKILKKLYDALKIGGKLVIEVFHHNHYSKRSESSDWEYIPENGFWKSKEYLELNAFYRYDNENVVLIQAAAIDDTISVWNSWMKTFDIKSLQEEFMAVGITSIDFYSDVTGNAYDNSSEVICAVITRI